MNSDEMIDELVSAAAKGWHDTENVKKRYEAQGVLPWAFERLEELFSKPSSFQYFVGGTGILPTEIGENEIEELKEFLREPEQAARLTYETKTLPPAEWYVLWKTEETVVKYRQENDREERFTIHYLTGDHGCLKVSLDANGNMTDCFGY